MPYYFEKQKWGAFSYQMCGNCDEFSQSPLGNHFLVVINYDIRIQFNFCVASWQIHEPES